MEKFYSYDPTKTIIKLKNTVVFFPQVESIKLLEKNIEIHYVSGRSETINIPPEELISTIFEKK